MWKLPLIFFIQHWRKSCKTLLVESNFWGNKSRQIQPSYVKFILYIRKINHLRKHWNYINRKVTEQLLPFLFCWMSYFHYITVRKRRKSVVRVLVMFSFTNLTQLHLIWLTHPYQKGKMLTMNDSRWTKVSELYCY